jgi:four helix bundle protein
MDAPQGDVPDLKQRLFAFSLRIVRLCQKLDEKRGVARNLGYQLLKAGTSIGANYEEAQAGQSRADFICKTAIALKEARETHYWLRLIREGEIIGPHLIQDLVDEADQLTKTLGAIVSRSR